MKSCAQRLARITLASTLAKAISQTISGLGLLAAPAPLLPARPMFRQLAEHLCVFRPV